MSFTGTNRSTIFKNTSSTEKAADSRLRDVFNKFFLALEYISRYQKELLIRVNKGIGNLFD
jgi:hypothetical protein